MKNYNVYLFHEKEPIFTVAAKNTLDAHMKAYAALPDEEEKKLIIKEAWSEIKGEYKDSDGNTQPASIKASAYTGENSEGITVYGVKIELPDESKLDIRSEFDENGFLQVFINGHNLYE